jgi:ABC-type lipoprotein export system ATPase subunit
MSSSIAFIHTKIMQFINAIPCAYVMGAVLRADSLWKVYYTHETTVEAVRGIHLTIDKGEMIAVMGPSGCGKTTLLNVLSGIDDPSAGDVFVNDISLYKGTENQRTDMRAEHFGFIYQNFNLLPVLTAVENVELPLLLNGVQPAEARRRGIEALSSVGLSDRLSHRPAELSGGQQQRVAIARAIVHRPAIVLCDEPTGNLDSATSKEIMTLLKSMNTEHQMTFLIVTHDQSIADECGRTISMVDGHIIAPHHVAGLEEE